MEKEKFLPVQCQYIKIICQTFVIDASKTKYELHKIEWVVIPFVVCNSKVQFLV
jgi:hypothetical protein